MSAENERKLVEISTATTAEDVDRINQFFNSKEIKSDLHWFTYRDTLVRAFEREDRQLLYLEGSSGDIVGALMVWCESRVLDEGEAQIRLVAVSPNHRGKGIGSHLCDCAEDFALQNEQDRMIADVVASSPAVDFWHALGYGTIEEWETNGGRTMLTVQKELK